MLDSAVGRTTYTLNAAFYAKLHLGDPGSAGTTNAAVETTRAVVTFGDAAATGAITNTAAVAWTDAATTETITHISFWTADAAGTFLGSDDLPASKALTAGDNFSIPIGDCDLAVT